MLRPYRGQWFCYGFYFLGHFNIRTERDVRPASSGEWFTSWLQWGRQSTAACRLTSSHSYLPYICMHTKINWDRRLSVMMNSSCDVLANDTIAVFYIAAPIHLCCINFHFEEAGCVGFKCYSHYWIMESILGMRLCGTHRDLTTFVLVEWHNFDVIAAPPTDRSVCYICIFISDWTAHKAYRCFRVWTSLVFFFFLLQQPVLRICSGKHHHVEVVVIT